MGGFFNKANKAFSKVPLVTYIILIVITVSSIISRHFFTVDNLLKICDQSAVLLIIAASMTLVIMIGEIDLSAGAVASLTAVIIALIQQSGANWIISIFIGLFIGLVAGLINGMLIAIEIPSFIVTLGMMYMAKGVALGLSDGATVSGLNANFVNIFSGFIGSIPVNILIAIICCLVISFFLNFTTLRSHLFSLGFNKGIAIKAGVRVKFNRILVFAISGLFASIAGILFAARLNCGHPTGGIGYEFEAIASVVIGGNPLIGGFGSLLNTILGVSLVGILKNSLNMFNFPVWWQMGINGSVLILALIIGNVVSLVTYKKSRVKGIIRDGLY